MKNLRTITNTRMKIKEFHSPGNKLKVRRGNENKYEKKSERSININTKDAQEMYSHVLKQRRFAK